MKVIRHDSSDVFNRAKSNIKEQNYRSKIKIMKTRQQELDSASGAERRTCGSVGRKLSDAAGKAFEGLIQGGQSVGENPTPATLAGVVVGSLHQVPEHVVLIQTVQKGNFVSRRESAYDL